MRKIVRRIAAGALSAVALMSFSACLGSTGNTLVQFRAAVAGPTDAVAGTSYSFTTHTGWHVVLSTATLHVGALYLTQVVTTSGGGPAPCTAQGTYVGQVTTLQDASSPVVGINVNLLSPALQYFLEMGEGTSITARSAQVWLTSVQVDQDTDPTAILSIDGVADKGGQSIPFDGDIHISSSNRLVPPTDATKPGSNPICQQRIVSPIPVDLVPRSSGVLLMRVDPTLLFEVDFSTLPKDPKNPQKYQFADNSNDTASSILYQALHNSKVYQFSWEDSP